nr:immunoglobulin heavy chain junction region [Mus musculus]MBK4195108.1 immunoglobulin heavy chain junction region [Mus musculus]
CTGDYYGSTLDYW